MQALTIYLFTNFATFKNILTNLNLFLPDLSIYLILARSSQFFIIFFERTFGSGI